MRRRLSGMLRWLQSSSADTALSSGDLLGAMPWHTTSVPAGSSGRHTTRWLPCGGQTSVLQSAGIHLGSCHGPATTCDSALAV